MVVPPRKQVKIGGKIYGAGSVIPDPVEPTKEKEVEPIKTDSDLNKDIPVEEDRSSSEDEDSNEIENYEPAHRDVIDDVLDGTMRKKPSKSRRRSYNKTKTGE